VFLGALTGAIFGGVTRRMGRVQDDRTTRSVLTLLNSSGVTDFLSNTYNSTVNAHRIAEDMKEAVKNNDIFKYKNFQNEQFVNFITSGLKAGRFDVRIDQLDLIKEMSNEEFRRAFGLDKTTESLKTVDEYVDQLKQHAQKIKKSYELINDTFTNPFSFNTKGTTPEQLEENEKYLLFEDWKSDLTFLTSIASDVDNRLISISKNLRNISPSLEHYHVANFVDKKYLKSYAQNMRREAKHLQSLIDQKVSTEPDLDRRRIKSLEAKSSLVDLYLEGGKLTDKRFEKLFGSLLTYHLNGQQDQGLISIPQEAVPKLIEYGRDVIRLREYRDSAYEAFDKLSTEEGFDRYFTQAQLAKQKFDEKEIPVSQQAPALQPSIETVEVKSKTGETRTFKRGVEVLVNIEGKPDTNLQNVTILSSSPEGVKVVKSDGTTETIPHENFFLKDVLSEKITSELQKVTKKYFYYS